MCFVNSDSCHLRHKLIGLYNREEKCLQRGTDWVFKWSGLRFVFKRLNQLTDWHKRWCELHDSQTPSPYDFLVVITWSEVKWVTVKFMGTKVPYIRVNVLSHLFNILLVLFCIIIYIYICFMFCVFLSNFVNYVFLCCVFLLLRCVFFC
jgi:hypothetical protein